MNPITPWAQDAIDKVRYQAGEYRRRKAERAALERVANYSTSERACMGCGYIQCSCAYNSMIRVYRSMFLDTAADRTDDELRAAVADVLQADTYSRPRAGPRLTYGPVMTMDGKLAALSLGEAGRKLRAEFDACVFERNYFASFELPPVTHAHGSVTLSGTECGDAKDGDGSTTLWSDVTCPDCMGGLAKYPLTPATQASTVAAQLEVT